MKHSYSKGLWALAALLLALPGLGSATSMIWYIDDGPDAGYSWEDTSLGSFWEYMYGNAIEDGDSTCTIADLLTNQYYQPYYATTYPMDVTYLNHHFWAELYLENSWPGYLESITVTLGTGTPGVAASFTPLTAPVTVSGFTYTGDYTCGVLVEFDFGILPVVQLAGNSLILKIDHPADTGGTTHIFWDGWCCPSALHMLGSTAVMPSDWSTVKGLYR